MEPDASSGTGSAGTAHQGHRGSPGPAPPGGSALSWCLRSSCDPPPTGHVHTTAHVPPERRFPKVTFLGEERVHCAVEPQVKLAGRWGPAPSPAPRRPWGKAAGALLQGSRPLSASHPPWERRGKDRRGGDTGNREAMGKLQGSSLCGKAQQQVPAAEQAHC